MNLIAKVIIAVFGGKFRKALRDAEKITDEEPGFKARLKQFSKESNDLAKDMEVFCKRYPDSPLCHRDRGKSLVKDVEY